MICNSYVFQREIFSIQKKYQIAPSKLCFLLLVHISFFYFPPYLGHQQLRIQKAFFPQKFANFLDEQASRIVMKPEPKESFQASV